MQIWIPPVKIRLILLWSNSYEYAFDEQFLPHNIENFVKEIYWLFISNVFQEKLQMKAYDKYFSDQQF